MHPKSHSHKAVESRCALTQPGPSIGPEVRGCAQQAMAWAGWSSGAAAGLGRVSARPRHSQMGKEPQAGATRATSSGSEHPKSAAPCWGRAGAGYPGCI